MIYQAFIYFLIAIFIFGVLFFLGPRLNMNVQLKPIVLPADLDGYLAEQESAFSDIKSNSEKKIFWVDEHKQQSELSIVYIHGFSASRQELSPMLENISRDLSANIYFTRLSGHGRSNEAMAEITLNAMLNDAVEAIEIGRRIGKKVILVGNSTGATLISWLASQPNFEQVAGMVLMSPNYGLKNPKSKWLLLPWAQYFIPIVEGPVYRFKPDGPLQAKYWTYEYPVHALFPMMALLTLTNKIDFENIKTPLLMMYSEQDGVVDVGEVKKAFERFGAKDKFLLEVKDTQGKQRHVLAGDALSPRTTGFVSKEIMKFVRNL